VCLGDTSQTISIKFSDIRQILPPNPPTGQLNRQFSLPQPHFIILPTPAPPAQPYHPTSKNWSGLHDVATDGFPGQVGHALALRLRPGLQSCVDVFGHPNLHISAVSPTATKKGGGSKLESRAQNSCMGHLVRNHWLVSPIYVPWLWHHRFTWPLAAPPPPPPPTPPLF